MSEQEFSIPNQHPNVTSHVNSSLGAIESSVNIAIENAIKTAVIDAKGMVNEILRNSRITEYDYADLISDIESHLREQCDWRYKNGFWISSWEEDY